MHPSRREKELQDIPLLRQQLLVDLQKMCDDGVPLSPGFLRQLGKTARADEVEAYLLNQSTAEVSSAGETDRAATSSYAAQIKQRHMFEVECILEQRTVQSKMEYLVRWAGYHPTWEAWRVAGQGQPGDPLQTWEPEDHLEDTIALFHWLER